MNNVKRFKAKQTNPVANSKLMERATCRPGLTRCSEMTGKSWRQTSGAGFTVIELLIVTMVISVASGFAIMQVGRARQIIARTNKSREVAAYLEKVRRDSIRRRPATVAEMGQVTLVSASSFTATFDSDGDGVTETKTFDLTNSGITFNGTLPRTIRFNWRGRAVDSSGNATTPAAITLRDRFGTTTINVTNAGDSIFDVALTADAIVNSTAPTPQYRKQTQLP